MVKTFKNVLPKDKLPKKISQFPSAYILNTDSSDQRGKHWVVCDFESPNYAEFFDSYGNHPKDLADECNFPEPECESLEI